MENETKIKTENENEVKTTEETTTVGMFLKYTRMKQKKSIEAVSKALCIRTVYILAIESDDYETLSPVPYGTGFVRSYAAYLGLNPDRIVQFYKRQYLPKNEKKSQTIVKEHIRTSVPTIRLMIFCLCGILLLYLIFLAIHYTTENKKDVSPIVEKDKIVEVISSPEDVLPQTDPLIEEQENTEQSSPSIKEPENIKQEVIPDNNSQINIVTGNYVEEAPKEELFKKMVLKFKGDSWMELKDSNKVYISGTFEKGFEYTVPAEKGLILSVGKYYNVDIYVDDVLTKVATPKKQTGIELDPILKH